MKSKEIWKNVKGYTRYEISNLGKVRNSATKRLKAVRKTKTGYCITDLKENGVKKTKYIHRLVAEAFLDNRCDFPCINHRDENKQNNKAENLEWCTIAYNNTYNARAKRIGDILKHTIKTRKRVRSIENGEIYMSVREAGRKLGISPMGISYCLNGKQKTAGGFQWEVVE